MKSATATVTLKQAFLWELLLLAALNPGFDETLSRSMIVRSGKRWCHLNKNVLEEKRSFGTVNAFFSRSLPEIKQGFFSKRKWDNMNWYAIPVSRQIGSRKYLWYSMEHCCRGMEK